MDNIIQRYLNMENSGIGIYFDADEIIELLDYFEFMGDLEHHKKVLKLGQRIHPHSIDIKIRVCKVHIDNEDFEKALILIEQIGDPENRELRFLKYECLCALGRYNEVIAILETQLTHPDGELQDTFELFALLLNEYKSEHAYDLISRGLALFPDNCQLKEELCFYFEMQGDWKQALEISKELVDTNPYSADYWSLHGRLYVLMDAYDKAIESFDFALICDDSDLEIKILKAYCYFMNQNHEKVIEIYIDVFAKETEHIIEYIRLVMETTEYAECAYILLRKMLEEFEDFQGLTVRDLPFVSLENDRESNGFSTISASFPSSLLFFLLKELLFLADGVQQATKNIEQLLHAIYQTGINNKQFQLDPESPSCVSLKQKVANIVDGKTPDTGSVENDFDAVRQIITHLLDGNISLFCRQYEQCSSEVITKYVEKIFLPAEKRQRQQTTYLLASEIHKNDLGYIPSNKLSANYLNDRNHYN